MRACIEIETLKPTEFNEPPDVFRFSTDETEPRDRLDAWRNALARVHVVPNVAPSDEPPLRAMLEHHSYPCMALSFIETSPTSLSCPATRASRGCNDRYLVLVDGSRFDLITDGVVEHFDCGDAVLLSGIVTVTIRLHAACRVTLLRLPASSEVTGPEC